MLKCLLIKTIYGYRYIYFPTAGPTKLNKSGEGIAGISEIFYRSIPRDFDVKNRL